MARFLHHTSCPKCNSRDNLGVYDDASTYCFGCGYRTSGRYVPHHVEEVKENPFPNDLIQEYPLEVVQWVTKYGITIPELINRDVYWSPSKRHLLFTFGEFNGNKPQHDYCNGQNTARVRSSSYGFSLQSRTEEAKFIHSNSSTKGTISPFAAARTFNPGAKSRYTTYGNRQLLQTIYKEKYEARDSMDSRRLAHIRSRSNTGRSRIVLVEDCLSAIKIARQSDCMPLLTSTLNPTSIRALAGLYGAFLVWLDGNMFHKAQRIAQRCQLLGMEGRAVYTPLDPKEYDNGSIKKMLDNTP